MKKSILFVFALIPTLASCNNNSNGFPNPFPEDQYPRIGLNITEDEMVKEPLSSQETALVDSTYARLDEYNQLITKVTGEVHERNYERAFAGVFEQGYSISNRMFDNEFSTVRVGKSQSPKYECRQETNSETTTVVDYSYGKSTVHSTTKSFHYLGEYDNAEEEYKESEQADDSEYVLEQTLETYSSGKPTTISASILEEKPLNQLATDDWYSTKHFEIPMTGFIFPIASATSIPGVTKNDEVVLIKEAHTPYEEKGIYSLPDGRSYEAMVNSIVVTRLKVMQTKTQEDWYIVNHVRQYSETVITSDIIQPNVPISYLTNPIIIKFREETYQFSVDDKVTSIDTIPGVKIN
ncbi:MAG: hypothetical protein MJ214_02415 [Bacilli bacterium]|nr:hypothetical protein [Bacilli bacterium]